MERESGTQIAAGLWASACVWAWVLQYFGVVDWMWVFWAFISPVILMMVAIAIIAIAFPFVLIGMVLTTVLKDKSVKEVLK